MATHGILGGVLDDDLQERDGVGVAGLAEAVGEFVLEQGGRGREGGGDGLDRGQGLVGGRLETGEVLEREEGAESARERL